MFSIEIDSNNQNLLAQLAYFLKTNHLELIELQCNEYVLLEYMKINGEENSILLPKITLHIPFEEDTISIEYSRSREPLNFSTMVIRFERYHVCSKKSLEHVSNFINMISEFKIPDARQGELIKYVWDCDERYWSFTHAFKKRRMDTIYLQEKDEIVNTINTFLHDEKRQELYDSLDISSKYVFLLYGLPGTGKTSLIRALASHFQHNLAIVKNSKKLTDETLENMLHQIPKNSFLVFEDIDGMFDHRQIQNNTGITYSGLLNMLDGINHYNKLVVFITTNVIQNLDCAFRRRVDNFIEFSYVKKAQIIDMYSHFYPENKSCTAEEFYTLVRGNKMTVNILEKYFIHCILNNIEPQQSLSILNDLMDKMTIDRTAENLYV